MQQTSELYQVILADAGHRKEYKVVIAGKEYGQDQIVSLETSGCSSRNPSAPAARCPGRRSLYFAPAALSSRPAQRSGPGIA